MPRRQAANKGENQKMSMHARWKTTFLENASSFFFFFFFFFFLNKNKEKKNYRNFRRVLFFFPHTWGHQVVFFSFLIMFCHFDIYLPCISKQFLSCGFFRSLTLEIGLATSMPMRMSIAFISFHLAPGGGGGVPLPAPPQRRHPPRISWPRAPS